MKTPEEERPSPFAAAKENEVVKAAVAKQQLAVIGAFYDISSGQVDFLETDEDLRVD